MTRAESETLILCPNCGHSVREHFDPWGNVEFCKSPKNPRKGFTACLCESVEPE